MSCNVSHVFLDCTGFIIKSTCNTVSCAVNPQQMWYALPTISMHLHNVQQIARNIPQQIAAHCWPFHPATSCYLHLSLRAMVKTSSKHGRVTHPTLEILLLGI